MRRPGPSDSAYSEPPLYIRMLILSEYSCEINKNKTVKNNMRLTSDVDANQIKRIFDVLREETTLFEGQSAEEVASVQ